MSIIPWLNYPGRPIKKKSHKMPYVPPYKGSPYEYIDLPNPGDIPKAAWENIMKDFNQTLSLRYKTLTSATLESAADEFKEQPGAVGAGITIDPRKYLDKGVKAVFADTFKEWVQSVVSWTDLDTIVEQNYIWRPLTRGKKSYGGLNPLLHETAPGVFRDIDRARYESFYSGDPKFSTQIPNDIENLSTNIETWAANGKSKGSRAFPWSQVQRYWLTSIEQAALIGSGGTIPASAARAAAFAKDVNDAIAFNTWVASSSSPKGFRAPKENPFYTSLKGAPDWASAERVLAANGFNPKNDNILFDYRIRESLASKLGKKKYNVSKIDWYVKNDPAQLVTLMQGKAKEVAELFGDTIAEADILALTPAGLSDLLEKGKLESARSFYESKIILPGGQLNVLEANYIFKPSPITGAALAKHAEIQKKLELLNKEYETRVQELHRRVTTDTSLQGELKGLMGGAKFDNLMQWQNVLNFREAAFKTQDFLDAAFDDNSLFRTYIWLGRISRDLPDWMGNWKDRLKYMTPQFYVSGVLTYLDENFLGLASLSKTKRGFMFFHNGGWVALKGKASYQLARDYTAAIKVIDSLDNLVNEGATIKSVLITADVKRELLLNRSVGGLTLADIRASVSSGSVPQSVLKHLLKDSDYTEYVSFLSGKFAELESAGLVSPGEVEWLVTRVKSKLIGKNLYMGPLVGLGRLLDHLQNLFVDNTIGRIGIFKRYADWFKAGNPALARAWQASRVGGLLNTWSTRLISISGGGGSGSLARIMGSRILSPFTKVLGSFLGAVGGMVVGFVAWFGTKLLSDLWSLLQGKPVEATKKAIGQVGKFILKAVGCCIAPILLVGFILFFAVAGIFQAMNVATTAVTVGDIFDRLDVSKAGTYDPASNSINYTVTVTNKSSKAQLIQFVSDSPVVYFEDCSETPLAVTVLSSGTYGYLDFSGMSPGVQEHLDLQSGSSVEYKYSIKNIPSSPGNVTYVNRALIEILPRLGVGISDTGSVKSIIDMGSGGCKEAGDLAAISEELMGCLRTTSAVIGPYIKLDMSCVSGKPILNTLNCQRAVASYYFAGSIYYPNNLQCVAFANIAVGCYGGPSYYVTGDGTDWYSNASPSLYTKYAAGSAPFAPPAGSILVFDPRPGHVGIVISSKTAGNRTTVEMVGSNMYSRKYSLLFDDSGNLISSDVTAFGLTFKGFLVPN